MKINRGKIRFVFQRKNLIYLSLNIVGIFIVFLYAFFLFLPWTPLKNPGKIEVTIRRGMTPQEIAFLLREKGVIRKEKSFLLGAKLLGVTRKLQAGCYLFQGKQTNYSVLYKLYKGHVITEQVTLPEGIRATKIASIIQKTFGIDSVLIMNLVNDEAFSRSLDINALSLEGYLYPDTYRFQLNSTTEEILQVMVSRFYEMFVDSLIERTKKLGMSVHQVITLASIVEGEAVLDSERVIIAALYQNRLKRGMRLQADPTIQYIIKDGPRRLLKRDLKIDSPYNTYIHSGLPPGPVNNPGMASIIATLYPASVDYIFMVANGDGSHTFSRTIQAHLRAKRRFDKVRKKVTQRL